MAMSGESALDIDSTPVTVEDSNLTESEEIEYEDRTDDLPVGIPVSAEAQSTELTTEESTHNHQSVDLSVTNRGGSIQIAPVLKETEITKSKGLKITYLDSTGKQQEKYVYLKATVGDIIIQLQAETDEQDISLLYEDRSSDGAEVPHSRTSPIDTIMSDHRGFLLKIGPVKHDVTGLGDITSVINRSRLFSVNEAELIKYMKRDGDELPNLEYGSVAQTHAKLKNLYKEMGDSSSSYVTSDDGTQFYNMSGFKGRVLLIDVNTFKDNKQREGSDEDVRVLTECFMKLGFQVKDRSLFYPPKNDGKSIMGTLDTEINDNIPGFEDCKMFVLVIMTHGNYSSVANPDSTLEELSAIYKRLSRDQFKAMTGKPKLIIVNSCSGTDMSDSYPGPAESDAFPTSARKVPSDQSINPINTDYGDIPLPLTKNQKHHEEGMDGDDICIWRASFPGYKSWRDQEEGAWFIRAITETLYKHAHHAHLGELFEQIQVKVRAYSMYRQKRLKKKHKQLIYRELKEKKERTLFQWMWDGVLSVCDYLSFRNQKPVESGISEKQAQHPCQSSFFVCKRKVYLFPNLETYEIAEDGKCTININLR